MISCPRCVVVDSTSVNSKICGLCNNTGILTREDILIAQIKDEFKKKTGIYIRCMRCKGTGTVKLTTKRRYGRKILVVKCSMCNGNRRLSEEEYINVKLKEKL